MTRAWSTLLITILSSLVPAGTARAGEKPAVHSFDSNGTKIAYFVQGAGEPVVLIHGWISSAGINWILPGTSELLAKDHQVIGLDVRGHGLSDKPTGEDAYGPELVEDVVRLLDHLKIKKAHIVGYSMGGIIAGNFIAKHPDRAISGTLGGMGWLSAGGVGQFGFAQIGKNDRVARPMTVCGRSLAKLALTQREVEAIRVPITVLIGDQDGMIKGLYVDPLVKVRNDWPVVTIKDANHISCVMKPQFREAIAAWVNQNKE